MLALGHALDGVPTGRWAQVGALIEVPLTYPELTVRQNLRIVCLLCEGDPDRLEDAVTAWHLCPVSGRWFRHLSLRNQQRVGLTAAIQYDPRLIVLDERSNVLSTSPR